MGEDEEKMINAIQIKYEKRLHSEKENNTNLKRKADVMIQKVTKVATIDGLFAPVRDNLCRSVILRVLTF